jgi:hypothetical protein
MKKIFAFFVLLLLVACGAPKEQAPAVPNETAPAAEPAAAAPEPVIAEQSQVEVESKPLPDDAVKEKVIQEEQERIAAEVEHIQPLPQRNRTTVVGEMLNTYNTIDSYQFKTSKGTYYVRGDKVRFLPIKTINVRNFIRGATKYPEIFVDEVIFDRTDKTATGYCFGFDEETRRECESLKMPDIPFNLSYSEYFTKMPDDWSKEYASQAVGDEEHEKYFLNSIETTRVAFKDGTEMFFSPLAGVPIKVVKGPLESYTFDSLVINRVRPEDVIHRTRAQIPPNEVFYKPIY